MKHAGHARWFRAFVALVFLASTAIPAFMLIDGMKAYAISPEVEKVIGNANKNLSAKFSFDETNNKWQFNKDGAAALAANIARQQGTDDVDGVAGALSQLTAKQVGGAGEKDTSLYSVDLPVKAKEGITYYDNVNKLSFKMVPDFGARDGKLVQDRIVYPFGDDAQVVYTAKSNGMKEDIVLSKYIADTLRYSYNLELPETLEAKLLDDGSIGIYSANLALFGNISFSGDADKAKVMEARKTGTKDNLVFSIPPPFIKDQTGDAGHTKYLLNGSRVTVVADQLKNLKYPLTVDPSVTVTSSSDFGTGNNEGMTSFDTDQITRGGVTGANTGTWGAVTATNPFTARENFGTAIYNGFVYVVGGTNAIVSGVVNYARLTANGTLSNNSCGTAVTWCTGPSITVTGETNAIAYNGYLYSISKNKVSDTVEYIQINTDGSLGASWSNANTGAAFPLRFGQAALAYNGYMYVLGGCGTGNLGQICPELINAGNTVYKAEIRANGQLGAWSNANTGASFTQRFNHNAYAYNGYMYVLGGCDTRDTAALTQGNCLAATNDVSYAKIDSSGNLGAWASTNPFATARIYASGVVHNGYMYILPGCDNGNGTCQGGTLVNNTQYAPIYANGSLGAWVTTTTLATARHSQGAIVSSGYIYQFGGCTSAATNCNTHTNYLGDAQSARIDIAGSIGVFGSESNYDPTAGRLSFATVTYNNYIYVLGGTVGSSGGRTDMRNTARYAPINAGGAIGTWNTSTAGFNQTNSGTGSQTCTSVAVCPGRVNLAAGAYNGYMYIAGGVSNGGANDHWSDVQSAVICTGVNVPVAGCAGAGDLRNWTTLYTDYLTNSTTTYTEANGRSKVAMQIYNGKMYLLGGQNNITYYSHIYTSTLTNTGGAGNFTLSGVALPSLRSGTSTFVNNNKLYIVGGGDSGPSWAFGGSDQADVQFASIDSSGNLTAGWTDANAIINGGSGSSYAAVNGRNAHSIAVNNGVLYIAGGYVGGSVAGLTTIVRAAINANGSLGSWSSTTSFTTARVGLGVVAEQGTLYVIGGCAQLSVIPGTYCNSLGQISKTFQASGINNGGTGTSDTWTAPAGDDLPAGRSQQYSFVYNDRAYAIGGIDNSGNNYSGAQHGYFATFDKMTGSKLTGWTSTTNAPGTILGNQNYLHHKGYVYQLGGRATSNATSVTSVNFTQINSGGTFDTWQSTSPLNTGRSESSVVAWGNYIYVFGGCASSSRPTLDGICSSWSNTVEVGTINPATGQITGWSLLGAGNNFTAARSGHQVVVYNGYVYLMGGCTSFPSLSSVCDGLRSDVQIAKLNGSSLATDAGCGAVWCSGPDMGVARREFIAQAYSGYLYIATGYEPSLATVQVAPIHASGSIGRWETAVTSLTAVRKQASSFIYAGRLYVVAGNDGPGAGSTRTDVQRAVLKVIPRISQYTKLLAISPTTDVAGVYYNGTLPAGSSVTYRVAPTSGVFGAVIPGIQGTGSEPTPLCGLGTIYYVQLMATIDDSSTATFPESNQGNVTDFTVYYRLNATPPPNLRMTGGKWFWNEMQRELDTCKQANS